MKKKSLAQVVKEAKKLLADAPSGKKKKVTVGKETGEFVYRIRRKKDGLFAMGGDSFHFTKRGKTWASIGALKNHFRQQVNNKSVWVQLWESTGYSDCEVVVCELSEIAKYDVVRFMGGK